MKHPCRQADTQKYDFTNPGGVTYFNPRILIREI